MFATAFSLRYAIMLAAVLVHAAAQAQSLVERAQKDELAFMAAEEPAMRKAFERARATLEDFLKAATQPAPGTTGYAVKVAVTEGKNTEYFWVSPFICGNGARCEGVLANEPRMVKKYKNGERFSFERNLIVDWTFLDPTKKRMAGNFTACALLTKEPPEQATKFIAQYGLQCD